MAKRNLFALMQVDTARTVSCALCGETVEPVGGLALFVQQRAEWWAVCPACAKRSGADRLADVLQHGEVSYAQTE